MIIMMINRKRGKRKSLSSYDCDIIADTSSSLFLLLLRQRCVFVMGEVPCNKFSTY